MTTTTTTTTMRLDGRRALVGGSTQGIGWATAVALAEAGAEVTLLARNADRLAERLTDLPRGDEDDPRRHDWLAADFTDPDAVRRVVADRHDAARPWHILVNNTGGPPAGRAIDADVAAYRTAFDAHVACSQILAGLLVPGMREAGYGRIVNVISTSVKVPIPGLGVSNTIRGAVAAWAKTLANELGPDAITVNNVLPGFTETDRLAALVRGRAEREGRTEEAVAEALRSTVPARRFGRASEVAAAILFLASPLAGYVNGVNLPVDGGRTGCL